jgi:hypothetical protein
MSKINDRNSTFILWYERKIRFFFIEQYQDIYEHKESNAREFNF